MDATPITWGQLVGMAGMTGALFTIISVVATLLFIRKKQPAPQPAAPTSKHDGEIASAINNFTLVMKDFSHSLASTHDTVKRTHDKTGRHEDRMEAAMTDIGGHMTSSSMTLSSIKEGVEKNGNQTRESEQKLHEHLSRSKGEILDDFKEKLG